MYTKAAPKGKRIAAYLIDGMILSILQSCFFLIFGAAGLFINGLLMFLYFGITEGGEKNGTIGKQAMGLIVVDKEGRPLDYGKAFVRALCKFVSYGIIVGPLIGLFAEDGRALHDMMAGTFVADGQAAGAPVYGYQAQGQLPGANGYQPQRQPQSGGGSYMKGTACIIGVRGAFAGNSFPVPENGMIMGRDQTACDFVFPDNQMGVGISRVHCKIQYNPQTQMFVLYDLGSSYGTFLGNGVRVVQGQPAALRPGEEFYLADRSISFRTVI